MSLDRYNTQKQRLIKLQKLSKEQDSAMTSKQHREMQVLKSSFDMENSNYSLQTILRIIYHIENLKSLNRATVSDLARLDVLKNKILDY